jgi:hypothetical protein
MNSPLQIIEPGNGLSPEKIRALRLLFWEEMICRYLHLPGQNFVQ